MMDGQEPFVVGSRSVEQQRHQEDATQQQEDEGNDELQNILMGLGLGFVIGSLLLKIAESGVKGDVASEFADALEAGVSSS